MEAGVTIGSLRNPIMVDDRTGVVTIDISKPRKFLVQIVDKEGLLLPREYFLKVTERKGLVLV